MKWVSSFVFRPRPNFDSLSPLSVCCQVVAEVPEKGGDNQGLSRDCQNIKKCSQQVLRLLAGSDGLQRLPCGELIVFSLGEAVRNVRGR
jgi:hypothetical protein